MDYTIKDACQKLNLTVHTVRHYCDTGLVPNYDMIKMATGYLMKNH